MMHPHKPLLSLTAADMMSPTVLTIAEHMSLRGAAHLLAQAGVSGAPVIDSLGRCIGVLSGHDFVVWAEKGGAEHPTKAPPECFCSAWQITTSGETSHGHEVVRNHMTRDPVTAGADTLIGTLAAMMIDAHIHRIIILDAARHPVGVVSSTDVLAVVAQAARVAEQLEESSHANHPTVSSPELMPC